MYNKYIVLIIIVQWTKSSYFINLSILLKKKFLQKYFQGFSWLRSKHCYFPLKYSHFGIHILFYDLILFPVFIFLLNQFDIHNFITTKKKENVHACDCESFRQKYFLCCQKQSNLAFSVAILHKCDEWKYNL